MPAPRRGAGLSNDGPFAFGSFRELGHNLHSLFTFQNGVFLTWLEKLDPLLGGWRWSSTLLVSIPGRIRPGEDGVQGP